MKQIGKAVPLIRRPPLGADLAPWREPRRQLLAAGPLQRGEMLRYFRSPDAAGVWLAHESLAGRVEPRSVRIAQSHRGPHTVARLMRTDRSAGRGGSARGGLPVWARWTIGALALAVIAGLLLLLWLARWWLLGGALLLLGAWVLAAVTRSSGGMVFSGTFTGRITRR